MNWKDHHAKAEHWLKEADTATRGTTEQCLQRAQVHALLALTRYDPVPAPLQIDKPEYDYVEKF